MPTKGELMETARDQGLVPETAEMDAAIPDRVARQLDKLANTYGTKTGEAEINSSHFCWVYMSSDDLFGRLYPLTWAGVSFLERFQEELRSPITKWEGSVAEELYDSPNQKEHRLRRRVKEIADALGEKRSDITEVLYDALEDKEVNVKDIGPRFVRYPMPDLDQYENGQVHAMLVDSETGFLELEDMRGERIGEAISPSDFSD